MYFADASSGSFTLIAGLVRIVARRNTTKRRANIAQPSDENMLLQRYGIFFDGIKMGSVKVRFVSLDRLSDQIFVALLRDTFLEGDLVLRIACFRVSMFSRYIRETARNATSVLVGVSWPSSAARRRSINAASTLDDSSFFFNNSFGWGRKSI
jgi:hypothetical protein